MKSKLTREQADRLHKEVLEFSLKNGFPVTEKKNLKQKQKQKTKQSSSKNFITYK